MNDLIEFLKARVAEDAREAAQDYVLVADSKDAGKPRDEMPRVPGKGPNRRLQREAEAKRRIIDILAEDAGAASGEVTQQDFGGELDRWTRATAVLRLLASVYDTHPDYRKEWALS